MKFILTTAISIALLSTNVNGQNFADMMGKLGAKTNYENEYSFEHTARMEISSTEKGGKKTTSSIVDMASDADEQSFSMEVISVDGKPQKEKAVMLFDIPNKTLLTLMIDGKGERSGMAMGFDPEEITRQVEAAENETGEKYTSENMRFTKTGKTKEILGYTCSEYTFDSDQSQGTAWITEDDEINITTFFGAMGQGKGKQKALFDNIDGYPEGMVMEMNSLDKKSGDTSEMRITAIDLDASVSVKPKDYNVMSLSNMMGN